MVKVLFQEVKKCLIAGSLALTSLSPSVTHASMEEEQGPRTLSFQQSHLPKEIFKYLTFEDFKETTPSGQSFLSFPNKAWREAFFNVKQVQVNLNSDERAHEFFKQGGAVDPSINASVRLFTLIKQKIVALTSTLTCLNLSGSEIEDDGVEALAAGNWPELWNLDLSKTKITDDGVTAFAAENWRGLRNLNLSSTKIGDNGILALVAGNCPNLRHLDLSNTKLTDDGVTAFAVGNWPELFGLNLSNTKIGNKGMQGFAAGNWPQLFDLDLSNTKIGNKWMQAFAAGNWPKLFHLDLSNTKIGNKGMQAFAGGSWPQLWRLYLSNTKMTVSSLGLLKKEKFPNLLRLFFSINLTKDRAGATCSLEKEFPGLLIEWKD